MGMGPPCWEIPQTSCLGMRVFVCHCLPVQCSRSLLCTHCTLAMLHERPAPPPGLWCGLVWAPARLCSAGGEKVHPGALHEPRTFRIRVTHQLIA